MLARPVLRHLAGPLLFRKRAEKKDRNSPLPKLPASDRRWQRRQRHTTTLYPTLNSWDDYLGVVRK
jgi:hypothetical protein